MLKRIFYWKYINAVIIAFIFFNVAVLWESCTPSDKFLYKQNKAVGVDRLFIRVLIKKTDSRILISSKAKLKIKDEKTGALLYEGSGRELYFHPEEVNDTIIIDGWNSPISVDNVYYRGIIELHNVLGNIYAVNVIRINEYLYSVVAGEIVSTWNMDALKAQAVAARTYTYNHLIKNKKSIFDLDNSTNFQVYSGVSIEKESTTRAVDETTGLIAVYNGKPIMAFFHSTCGGMTADDKDVWSGDDNPYLTPVKCNYCKSSPYFNWNEEIKLYEIRESLRTKYPGIGAINSIGFQREHNRVVSAIISHTNGVIKLTGNEFRLVFPEKKVKSMYFSTRQSKDGLILNGHGWGHGVGMCQWGAKGMAENGADFKEILTYYYSGIKIISAVNGNYAGK